MDQGNQDKLTPELEKLLKQVRLKEPPKDLMTDYAAGVNAKIEQQSGKPHFGFPQVVLVTAVGLVFAGIFYFISARPLTQTQTPALQPLVDSVTHHSKEPFGARTPRSTQDDNLSEALQSVNAPVQAEEFSIEEEFVLLEAFEDEFLDEENAVLGDEDLFEELSLLDELEISNSSVISTPGL